MSHVSRSPGRTRCSFKVHVEFAQDSRRVTLSDVATQQFGGFGPVVERDKSER